MILLFWLLAVGLLVWGYTVARKGRKDYYLNPGDNQLIGGYILTILLTISCILVPLSAGSTAAEYNAFYEANFRNYGVAVEETATLLSVGEFKNQLMAGSVEKWELAGYVSERIKEWRDSVNKFNLGISRYRFLSTHPFLSPLYPKLSNHIQPLTIGP